MIYAIGFFTLWFGPMIVIGFVLYVVGYNHGYEYMRAKYNNGPK